MASIVRKNNSFYVVYPYTDQDGKKKQRWESFNKANDALARKKEIEYKESIGTFVVPCCKTFAELLEQYVLIHGRQKWSPSTYERSGALIKNYILPYLGKLKVSDITTITLDSYYNSLMKVESTATRSKKHVTKMVTPHTVHDIHKIIRNCFNQAIKWGLVEKNPAENATAPDVKYKKREIWTAETLFHALEVCDDPRLALALNLAFSCSLRIGELLGLTWDCVDISKESIEADSSTIFIQKELQRIRKTSIDEVQKAGVTVVFPTAPYSKTVLVLKKPKKESSIRKIFVPKTVAKMLRAWKENQEETKEMMADEYHDYNLVFAGPCGLPTEQSSIDGALKRLIRENDLPPIVFHSFRHASVTYKLRLNGGDIKAVQGDTGHAQSKMVSDVYSHILDEGRKHNAQLFEKEFYNPEAKTEETPNPSGIDPAVLQRLLSNPETAAFLAMLAQKME